MIGVSGCVERPKPPATTAPDFCVVVDPEMLDGLRIREDDGPAEEAAKLRLWGYHECLCDKNCPAI